MKAIPMIASDKILVMLPHSDFGENDVSLPGQSTRMK
jgi:hypothetical protein